MKVNTLLKRLRDGKLTGDGTTEVKGVTHDSRLVRSGCVFAAIPGESVHGVEFVDDAIASGAVAVLSDRRRPKRIDVPWIKVKNVRPAMARAAWILAGNPQKKLRMIAVTGTNGKSTTADLISRILNAADRPTVFVGTLGVRFPDGTEIPGERTTPEATDLAPILKRALKAGAENVAMEVSSHALCQERVAGLEFDVAVWTNLTRDHLDYHGDMESYFEAKRRLFTNTSRLMAAGSCPVDDPWGARLLDEQREGDLSWGLDRGAVCARMVASDLEGSRFDLRLPETELARPIAAGRGPQPAQRTRRGRRRRTPQASAPRRSAAASRRPVLSPAGWRGSRPSFRFRSSLIMPTRRRVCVRSCRLWTGSLTAGLIVVFGAGGDRDRGKRGPMGYAVGELADLPIVTSDNPRSEDPAAIAEAVADGVRAAGGEPAGGARSQRGHRPALEIGGRTVAGVGGGQGARGVSDHRRRTDSVF